MNDSYSLTEVIRLAAPVRIFKDQYLTVIRDGRRQSLCMREDTGLVSHAVYYEDKLVGIAYLGTEMQVGKDEIVVGVA